MARGVDARWLIMFSLLVVSGALYWMTGLTLDVSPGYLVWLRIVQTFALGFFFVPLQSAAYLYLPREQINNATGLVSMLRNEGASLGVALSDHAPGAAGPIPPNAARRAHQFAQPCHRRGASTRRRSWPNTPGPIPAWPTNRGLAMLYNLLATPGDDAGLPRRLHGLQRDGLGRHPLGLPDAPLGGQRPRAGPGMSSRRFLTFRRCRSIISSMGNARPSDYSLVGRDTAAAIEQGLAEAPWYVSPVPREQIRELLERRDWPAIRDTLIWFALVFAAGVVAYWSWGTWWAVPAFLLYGVLYFAPADSRWHECSHGTPFKTAWLNNLVYEISSFMDFRESIRWRWSHTRHHSDTLIVGRDPEIAIQRPPTLALADNQDPGHQQRHRLFQPHRPALRGPARGGGKDLHSRIGLRQGDPRSPHLRPDLRGPHRPIRSTWAASSP